MVLTLMPEGHAKTDGVLLQRRIKLISSSDRSAETKASSRWGFIEAGFNEAGFIEAGFI